MNRSEYRPDIDGLRAIAVLLVLAFHAKLGFTGGYVGVDVFFVISGFLITAQILKQQQSGEFHLARFWERRIRRIFPAAFATAAATLLAGVLLLLPEDLIKLSESAVAQQAMCANFYFWRDGGYFSAPAESKPLLHTWSLAVEEQFYLVFPLLLMACRRLGNRCTLPILCGLAVVSFAMSEWGVHHSPSATFYLLPTRMWELLLGAILAVCPDSSSKNSLWRDICGWLGMVSILSAGLLFDSGVRFPGIAALAPCLGAAMVIYSGAARQASLPRTLSQPLLVFIGLISYSLYLWHWPILAFQHYWWSGELSLSARLAALLAATLLAWGSWKWIETPFRQSFHDLGSHRTIAVAIGSALVLMACAVGIERSEGLTWRLSAEARRYLVGNRVPKRFESDTDEVENERLPRVGIEPETPDRIDFLVWGDSHAMALGETIDHLAKERQLSGVIAARRLTAPLLGCWRPRFGKAPIRWNEEVLEYAVEKRISHVLFIGRWEIVVEGRGPGESDLLLVDEASAAESPAEAQAAFRRGRGAHYCQT